MPHAIAEYGCRAELRRPRIASAIFLVFVPTLLLSGFTTLVVLMVAVTALSGVLGAVFRPRGQGEPVEDIDARLTFAVAGRPGL